MRPGLFIWGVSRNWRDRDVTINLNAYQSGATVGLQTDRMCPQDHGPAGRGQGGCGRWRAAASGATAFQVRLCRCRCRRGRHRSAFRTTVIGEELRAEIRAASFRIGPADHDELPTVKAFHLAPHAVVTTQRAEAVGSRAYRMEVT